MVTYFIKSALSFLSLNCYEPVACCHLRNMANRLSDWPIYSPDVHRFCPDTAATPHLGALPWTCHISEWMGSIIETFLCYLL